MVPLASAALTSQNIFTAPVVALSVTTTRWWRARLSVTLTGMAASGDRTLTVRASSGGLPYGPAIGIEQSDQVFGTEPIDLGDLPPGAYVFSIESTLAGDTSVGVTAVLLVDGAGAMAQTPREPPRFDEFLRIVSPPFADAYGDSPVVWPAGVPLIDAPPGVADQAFTLEGSQLPTIDDSRTRFDTGDAFSVSFWLKRDATSLATYGNYLARQSSTANEPGWAIDTAGNRKGLQFLLANVSPNTPSRARAIVSFDRDLPNNQWIHLVATYDGSGLAAGMRLYCNGRQLDTSTPADNLDGKSILAYSGTPLTIKGRGTAASTFDGIPVSYADIRFHRRPLLPAEVADLYRANSLSGPWALRSATVDTPPVGATDWITRSWSFRSRTQRVEIVRAATEHASGSAGGALWVRFSDDDGETWSRWNHQTDGTPVVGFPMAGLVVGPETHLANNPCGVCAPNGDLLSIQSRVLQAGVAAARGTRIARSTDGGYTWAEGGVVSVVGKTWVDDEEFVLSGGQPIVIGDTIFASGWLDVTKNNAPPVTSILVKSTDNGATWEFVCELFGSGAAPGGANEPGLAHLGGDRMLTVARNGNNSAGITLSRTVTTAGVLGPIVEIQGSVAEMHRTVMQPFRGGLVMTGRDFRGLTDRNSVVYFATLADAELGQWHDKFILEEGPYPDAGYGFAYERADGALVTHYYSGDSVRSVNRRYVLEYRQRASLPDTVTAPAQAFAQASAINARVTDAIIGRIDAAAVAVNDPDDGLAAVAAGVNVTQVDGEDVTKAEVVGGGSTFPPAVERARPYARVVEAYRDASNALVAVGPALRRGDGLTVPVVVEIDFRRDLAANSLLQSVGTLPTVEGVTITKIDDSGRFGSRAVLGFAVAADATIGGREALIPVTYGDGSGSPVCKLTFPVAG